MPLSPIALLDLDSAKAYLKVEHDEENTLIEDLINQVSSRLEKRYDRVFMARDLVDVVDGEGEESLWLKYPIIDVYSVRAINEADPMPDTDYQANENLGYLSGRRWHGRYEVNYRAGYEPTELPDWVRAEAMELLSHTFEGRGGEL